MPRRSVKLPLQGTRQKTWFFPAKVMSSSSSWREALNRRADTIYCRNGGDTQTAALSRRQLNTIHALPVPAFSSSRLRGGSHKYLSPKQGGVPMQAGVEAFHWARAPGTAWQRMALEPFSRYPGLHSNRTTEPAENSEPIRLP